MDGTIATSWKDKVDGNYRKWMHLCHYPLSVMYSHFLVVAGNGNLWIDFHVLLGLNALLKNRAVLPEY